MKTRILVPVIALIVVFLAGFVPGYVKTGRLEGELRRAREQIAGADLRDLIGQVYVQANQKNYGLAAESAGRYFNRLREAGATIEPDRKKVLDEMLARRDKVTAALAKGDPGVMGDLQELFIKTREVTLSRGGL